MRSRTSPLKAFAAKDKLKQVSGELKKASNMHAAQAKKIDSALDSPLKDPLKPCQKAAAKRKFKVYPSAYANMYASNYKC